MDAINNSKIIQLPRTIIELKNICQSYDNGETLIIEDFNLKIIDRINQGQFVVILGSSGCGKSTILRYIAGLQKPTSGEVFINGELRTNEAIPMVFQQFDSSLPWLSVLQNVQLPLNLRGIRKKEAQERAMEIIQTVGLEGHEGKYAQYPLLSGGQLQRVAIARSLIFNPHIILMDEPFGSLDTNTRAKMQLMLLNIWTKYQSTVIFVTHDISEAVFLADDIYVMGGRPAKIIKDFHIDIPFPREREVKHSPFFVSYVAEIEEYMLTEIGH